MKPAYIEQVLLWLTIFVGFVTLLFIIIEFSNITRIQGNMDLMADAGAQMKSLGVEDVNVSASLNKIKKPYFNDIVADGSSPDSVLECVDTGNATYQIIFIVKGTYDDTNIFPTQNLTTKRVVYNIEDLSDIGDNSAEIECTLTLNH